MMKYRIFSRRKHFYNCPMCALVFISAQAIKSHYATVHPELPCEVVEHDDPLEDEAFEEFHANSSSSSYLYKDDSLYSLPKAAAAAPATATQVISHHHPSASGTIEATNLTTLTPGSKMDEFEAYASTTTLAPAKLITLTAPIEPTTISQHPQLQAAAIGTIPPTVYSIKVMEPTEAGLLHHPHQHQNGQIAKKSTIFTESRPVTLLQPQVLQPAPQLTAIATALPAAAAAVPTIVANSGVSRVAETNTQNTNTTTSVKEKPEKKYSCVQCGKFFSTIYNKRRHDDMFHNTNNQTSNEFKCSSCDKVFSSIYNKTRHENVHKPINERLKYKCVINNCNRGFTTQFILKMHIKKVHNMEVNF